MSLFTPFENFSREREGRKRRRAFGLLAAVLAVLVPACFLLWLALWRGAAPEQKAVEPNLLATLNQIKEAAGFLPRILGYERPQSYLVLFLNNDEIRPGGGFIGSYALVRMDRGKITEFVTGASEKLDSNAPDNFKVPAPEPLVAYLKSSAWYYSRGANWYFRNSNWSPDFPTSAQKSLWFYEQEGGPGRGAIDGVIGITPTLVEELLRVVGPVTVEGKEFTAQNFTEKLEYHVEVGYKEEGKEPAERKAILADLGRELIGKLEKIKFSRWRDLWSLFLRLSAERQVMIWSQDQELQKWFWERDWAGEVKNPAGDYALVVDSNMASLKTDPTVKKSVRYELRPEDGRLRAKVTATYEHKGWFDWRTTRFRTYTRLYAPAGSQLIASNGFIKDKKPAKAEESQELGKTVWGGFISIEPKETKTLVWEYYLPEKINQDLKKGLYTLFVQKQLGSLNVGLTTDLNFDKKVKGTQSNSYAWQGDLTVDREFKMEF